MFPGKQYHQINAFVRAHLGELEFTRPGELPESPIEWVSGHFQGMELAALIGLHYGLILREADPRECARYALDQNLPLPFEGFEQLLYESMILGLMDRGYSRQMIARLFEIIAVMADGAMRLIGHRLQMQTAGLGKEIARA